MCVCESVRCICKGDGCFQSPEVIHLRPTAHGGRLTGFLLPLTDGLVLAIGNREAVDAYGVGKANIFLICTLCLRGTNWFSIPFF